MRVADNLTKIVQKEFWKDAQKIYRYQIHQMQQQRHYEDQQKKLETFVTKQLKLSSKMADYLKEKEHKIPEINEVFEDKISDDDEVFLSDSFSEQEHEHEHEHQHEHEHEDVLPKSNFLFLKSIINILSLLKNLLSYTLQIMNLDTVLII